MNHKSETENIVYSTE